MGSREEANLYLEQAQAFGYPRILLQDATRSAEVTAAGRRPLCSRQPRECAGRCRRLLARQARL